MTSKEALEILVKQANERKLSNKIVANGIAVSLLEKLVERDTPKKVIRDDNSSVISADCPKCKRIVDNGYKGCPYCLQRLDWSEE